MKVTVFVLGFSLASGALNVALAGETTSANRFDSKIESNVAQLTTKKEFRNVRASVEDGIVTLTGSVDLISTEVGRDEESSQARES